MNGETRRQVPQVSQEKLRVNSSGAHGDQGHEGAHRQSKAVHVQTESSSNNKKKVERHVAPRSVKIREDDKGRGGGDGDGGGGGGGGAREKTATVGGVSNSSNHANHSTSTWQQQTQAKRSGLISKPEREQPGEARNRGWSGESTRPRQHVSGTANKRETEKAEEKYVAMNRQRNEVWAKRMVQEDERQAHVKNVISPVMSVASSESVASVESRDSHRDAMRSTTRMISGDWEEEQTESIEALRAERDRLREREAARMQRERARQEEMHKASQGEEQDTHGDVPERRQRQNTDDVKIKRDVTPKRRGTGSGASPAAGSEGSRKHKHGEHRHDDDHTGAVASHRNSELVACRRTMAGRAMRQTCSKSLLRILSSSTEGLSLSLHKCSHFKRIP
jgi:hypothetical protein